MKRLIGLFTFILIKGILIGQVKIDEKSFEKAIGNFEIENSLLIIGEAHEVKGTYTTELYLIKELIEKGKTTIILEGGKSEALIYNEYLETGNEDLLKLTRAGGENYRRLIKGIELLSKNKEIKFAGVDFERSICLEYVFNKWFTNIENQELLEIKNELLSISHKTNPKKLKNRILKIRSTYYKYEKELTKELGEESKKLKAIIFNPVFQSDYGLSSKKRDEEITKNILAIEKEELEKSILIFGSNHFTDQNHFGYKIGEKLKGKIGSVNILFAYKNCTNYLKKNNYTSEEPLYNYIKNELKEEPKISFKIENDKLIAPLDKENRFILAKILNQ